MKHCTVVLVACLLFATWTQNSGNGEQIEYVAAVLEHHAHQSAPYVNTTKEEAMKFMMENLDEYEQAAAQAANQGAQIIVFPEDALYGVGLPSISQYGEVIPQKSAMTSGTIVPCEDESFSDRVVLRRLSCIARKFHIALVANMADSQPPHFYNTDVAFDTDGRLLTKYHKVHLFFEDNFTPNTDPNPDSVFTTSFGVRFGLCTCYDILFTRPCFDYPTKLGITDLVFPTAWMNAFPLLYAITVQQAFSKMTNSNILAANLHFPLFRFTGSGIYSKGGRPNVIYLSNEVGKGRLLVARLRTQRARNLPAPGNSYLSTDRTVKTLMLKSVPSQLNKLHISHFVDDDAEYIYKTLPPSSKSFNLCSQEFCCHAEYDIDLAAGELFALGVFRGLKPRQPETFYYEACAVVKCAEDSAESCGKEPSNSAVDSTFTFLRVHANFHSSVDAVRLYPAVLASEFKLLDMTADVDLSHHSDNVWQVNVTRPFKLFSAGLFGRPVSLNATVGAR